MVRHMVKHAETGVAIATVLLLLVASARPAHGEVPTAVDFAACNDEAPRTIKAGSVSPTTGDHARAHVARASGGPLGSADVARTAVQSADPQLHGMQMEGARDATYQAAYRSCMRRKGF